MANRNNRPGQGMGRRMDYRNDRNANFGRSGVSPWQGGGPGPAIPNLLPLGGGSTEATLALANNLISNLLQTRQNVVPSLLDMPIRRDFGPDLGRPFDRGFQPNRMGNQGNFRRTGTYNRAGERLGNNRRQFRPNDGPRNKQATPKKDNADSRPKAVKAESNTSESEVKNETSEEPKGDGEQSTPKTAEEKKEKETPKTRYDDLNPQLLHCHICNKCMWDGRSFENHLNGRAHSIMMQKTAESYLLTADTMRQEFKIREMKRNRKSGGPGPRDFYCAMCDLYAKDGAIHRTTIGHRKLKKYLHPACTSCHKEMPTRIELDEHRLTPEHMKSLQDKKKEIVSKPKPEVLVISTLSTEQSYVRDETHRRRRRYSRNDDNNETKDSTEVRKEGEEAAEEDEEMKEEKKTPDDDNTIVDFKEGDDLSEVKPAMIPSYSTERPVGRSFLSEFSCVQCRLCRKLLDTQETAEVHLKTWRHHQLFTRALRDGAAGKESANDAGKRAAAVEEEEDNDSGSWKRRKTTPEHEANGNDAEITEEQTSKQKDGDAEMAEPEKTADCNDDWDGQWEKTVDEILKDENEPEKVEEVKEKEKSPEKKPEPTTPSRGRGRGRGRGRRN